MNHLFSPISWHQYLTAALTAVIIYYLFIMLRHYRPELEMLRRRIRSFQESDHLHNDQYRIDEEEIANDPISNNYSEPQEEQLTTEREMLCAELSACITRAADQPFAPSLLISKLRRILLDYRPISRAERHSVNRFIVNECERNGTALLSEDEVEQWWEG